MGFFNRTSQQDRESLLQEGLRAHDRKDSIKAIEYLEKAIPNITDEKRLTEAHLRLGTDYKRVNNLQSAFSEYQKAYELSERNVYFTEVCHSLGDICYLLNNHGEAVRYYMMAIHTAILTLPQEEFAMIAKSLFHCLGHALLDFHTEAITNEVKQQISEYKKLLMEQPNSYAEHLIPIYAEHGVQFFDKNNQINK